MITNKAMKTHIVLVACLLLASRTVFSQSTTNGISVQGIARDANKAAITDKLLTFTFEIQQASGGTSYYKESVDIRTDPYGVFSHIIGTGNVASGSGDFVSIPFRQTHMKLIISVLYDGTSVVVSNSPFQYVPYAISADNGVPTGTIVAFAGGEGGVPQGWVLCDGRTLTTINGATNLIALIGSNTPDLRGMFIRGTGVSSVNGQAGPALRSTQADALKSHSHTGTTETAGRHTHSRSTNNQASEDGDNAIAWNNTDGDDSNTTVEVDPAGDHTHNFTTNNTGAGETRPVNYGVNYIIKL